MPALFVWDSPEGRRIRQKAACGAEKARAAARAFLPVTVPRHFR